jgi:hypothetical protein
LLSVTVDNERLIPKCTNNKVRYDATVVGIHPRSVCIEYPSDLDLDSGLTVIVEEKRFCTALSFVVARTNTDGVDVSPIVFRLRIYFRISVNLARRSLKNSSTEALSQPEHIDGAVNARFGGLNRGALVEHRRSGAGPIKDPVGFDVKRQRNVMPDHLEERVIG